VLTIKICSSNDAAVCSQLGQIAEKQHEYCIEIKNCLGNCGQCYMEKFIKADGKFIALNEDEDIFEQLTKELRA